MARENPETNKFIINCKSEESGLKLILLPNFSIRSSPSYEKSGEKTKRNQKLQRMNISENRT